MNDVDNSIAFIIYEDDEYRLVGQLKIKNDCLTISQIDRCLELINLYKDVKEDINHGV